MMKKLLYIGHAYHNKTQSTRFLKDILESQYEVEYFDYDPYTQTDASFSTLKGKKYDILVIFQIMPDIRLLKRNLSFNKGVFFPMYDGVPSRKDPLWLQYKDFNIINFSATLHQELSNLGFSSFYIQYFPKPAEVADWGDDKSIFFWNRTTDINLAKAEILLTDYDYNKFHLHKALDPEQKFDEPGALLAAKLEISEWYDTREEMIKDMEKSAVYIAPRLYEGIGMSFLEAMAHGRCVIAPDNPTMNEYITDKVTGYLYNPNQIVPLALDRIKEIQKEAYAFICNGYQEWEKKKFEILKWLEADVVINKSKIKKFFSLQEITKIYFLGIEILRREKYSSYTLLKLFGFLPFVKILGMGNKSDVKILGVKLFKVKYKRAPK